MSGEIRSTTASGVGANQGSKVYESSRAVDEYLQFHFAKDDELVPLKCGAPSGSLQFPERLAALCEKFAPAGQNRRALDIGCAVGGATFALARTFEDVVGIDFSHAFISAANEMKSNRSRKYKMVIEGSIMEDRMAEVPPEIDTSRARFEQGDACNLPESLGQFDAVLAANLLCRLPTPESFLQRTATLIKKGGVLAMISPYSWLVEYTSPDRWIGGFRDDSGKAVFSADRVMATLKALGFELIHEDDMPFLIREHRRKYQWGCSHATVWRKL